MKSLSYLIFQINFVWRLWWYSIVKRFIIVQDKSDSVDRDKVRWCLMISQQHFSPKLINDDDRFSTRNRSQTTIGCAPVPHEYVRTFIESIKQSWQKKIYRGKNRKLKDEIQKLCFSAHLVGGLHKPDFPLTNALVNVKLNLYTAQLKQEYYQESSEVWWSKGKTLWEQWKLVSGKFHSLVYSVTIKQMSH